MYSYEELLNVIAQLRGEHGCPWDKAQTHESLIPCLRNECEEVVQAIEQHDEENLCEELGDVLLQVLLHARIAIPIRCCMDFKKSKENQKSPACRWHHTL